MVKQLSEAYLNRTRRVLQLQKFYQLITDSESKHHLLFIDLACLYFSTPLIEERLDELLTIEANIVRELPVRAALH